MAKEKAAAAQKRKPASGKAAPKTKAKSKTPTKAASAASPEVRAEPRPSPPRPAHLFKPGQSGNPAGRPKGIRQQLASDFVSALQKDFAEHGQGVIAQLRADKPAEYARLIAAVLPKVIEVEDEDGESGQVTGVFLVTKARIDRLIADGADQ